MHVGKNHESCPALKVHGTIIPEVTEETYLGDILSNDGRNTKNIKNRVSKGVGIVNQIFNMLENIVFGPHYFEIAVLLRDSMLINGTMTNAEIWYNFSKSEIEEFENVDRLFFRRLLEVPETTPKEAYYLELGVLPINVLIKARRINYLQTILKQEISGMLYSFFITQWHNPTKGDWTEAVKEDLKDFNIPCDFEYIENMSQEAFKRKVKVKAKDLALTNLKKLQENHSKMEKLHYNELKLQTYLKEEQFTIYQKKMLFRCRVRMEKFGENYRAGRSQVSCPLCHVHLDNQEMAFQCSEITKELTIRGNLEDIFSETVETLTKIVEIRKHKIEDD